MAASDKRKILLILRRSPYGSSLARASVDVALAAAAFDQAIDLLFVGDGVLQLLPGQDSRNHGIRNIGRQLASLPLYDIERVYVDALAAARHNIDLAQAPVDTCALEPAAMHQLMAGYDHLLGL